LVYIFAAVRKRERGRKEGGNEGEGKRREGRKEDALPPVLVLEPLLFFF